MQQIFRFALITAVLFVIGLGFSGSNFSAETDASKLQAWFLDVGQGDAILLSTPEGNQVLVDAGSSGTEVLSKLNNTMPRGDNSIELVVISHNHSDHIGGLKAVLNKYSVKKIWLSGAIHTTDTYIELLETIKAKNISTQAVKLGEKINFNKLSGIVLTPLQSFEKQMPSDQHQANITTLWQYGQTSILLTGDMEQDLEKQLLARNLISKVDVLKVGHHGSNTSSSLEFLKKLNPKLAIIQVGENNRYDHPNQEILDRLNSLSIPILRTDQHGTIQLQIGEQDFSYSTEMR